MIIGHCELRERGRFRSVPWFHGFRFCWVYGFYQTGALKLNQNWNNSCNSKALGCVSGPVVVAVAEHAHLFRAIAVPFGTIRVSLRRSWKPGTGQNQGDRQSNFDNSTTDAGDRVRVKISPAERWSALKNPRRAHAESAQDSHPRPTHQCLIDVNYIFTRRNAEPDGEIRYRP